MAIDAETRRRQRLIGAFATATFLIHLATDGRYGYFRDELYFLHAAHHLAWSYVDFAPLTAWLLRLNEVVLGDSLHALRLLPAIASAIKVALTGLLAIEFGADLFGIGLASLCVLAAPVYLVLDNQFAANTFEPIFWLGCVYVLIRAIKYQRPGILIWFGVLAGLGVENKLSMIFFCAAILLGVSSTPVRNLLRSSSVAIAILIATLCFLPMLLWQYHRGWPTLQMLGNVRRMHKNEDLSPVAFMLRQWMMLGPASALVWIPGLWFLLRETRWRALGFAYLVLLAIMMVLGAKDYYLAPIYPLLFAAGGAFWSGILLQNRARSMRYAIPILVISGGLITAPLALPILSPQRLVRYEKVLGLSNPRSQTGQQGVLPEHFGDEFGWPEMATTVAAAYYDLPAEDRLKTAILAKNYGEAGAIDFFGPRLGLPHAISGHQNYWYWGPGDFTGDVIIALQYNRAELLKMGCASVEAGPVVNHPDSMAEEHFRLEVCRGLHPPLAVQWPTLKRWN